tara:strand:+ start:609 stop:1046 length:438 start_codon:yes stop_codon:yes gene_type:complete
MAKLDFYWDEWDADSKIDRTELGEESIKIPQLHHKYYKFFSHERLSYTKAKKDLQLLKKNKAIWYMGIMSEEDLDSLGWDQNPLKILKQDVPMHVEADKDVAAMDLKVEYLKEKVEFLESVIKTLSIRSYQINNAITWEKFKVGI